MADSWCKRSAARDGGASYCCTKRARTMCKVNESILRASQANSVVCSLEVEFPVKSHSIQKFFSVRVRVGRTRRTPETPLSARRATTSPPDTINFPSVYKLRVLMHACKPSRNRPPVNFWPQTRGHVMAVAFFTLT